MIRQIFREHEVARPRHGRDAQENALRGAVRDEDSVGLRRNAQSLEPDARETAMPVKPSHRPAGAHEGAIVADR